ncbi:MAG: App1 family protein [Candidatus Cyclobacteriaceae bacterium M2_1C_046]
MPVFKYISDLVDNPNPVIIIPFGGYANDKMIHAQARVLEDKGINYTKKGSFFRNIYHSYKRFESDEKRGAKVLVKWGDQSTTLYSDKEGYIYLDQLHGLNLSSEEMLWIPITYELIKNDKVIYTVTSSIMKPSEPSEYGIISDLDDTVIHTGVTSFLKWKLLVNSFIKHSHKRMPLEGAREFYRLLHKGSTGYNSNPFFYLSNSPWNLYKYLSSFLQKFDFPKGTLMLRDMGLKIRRKKSFMEGNKYKKIIHILETYPSIPFILIGDAAEIDTDIYIKITKKYPEQILQIYIRSVKRKSNTKRIERLIEENIDVNVLMIKEGEEAIAHARKKNFISES